MSDRTLNSAVWHTVTTISRGPGRRHHEENLDSGHQWGRLCHGKRIHTVPVLHNVDCTRLHKRIDPRPFIGIRLHTWPPLTPLATFNEDTASRLLSTTLRSECQLGTSLESREEDYAILYLRLVRCQTSWLDTEVRVKSMSFKNIPYKPFMELACRTVQFPSFQFWNYYYYIFKSTKPVLIRYPDRKFSPSTTYRLYVTKFIRFLGR